MRLPYSLHFDLECKINHHPLMNLKNYSMLLTQVK
jgi:hypothetical protein